MDSQLAFLPDAKPLADPTHVQRFLGLLVSMRCWLSSRSVLMQLGLPDNETTRRSVRLWAEAAEDSVISGQQGYRHVSCATPEEINHFINWMESQATKMVRRAERVRRRAHSLVG